EFVWRQAHGSQRCVVDLDARWVLPRVECRAHVQPLARGRAGDQVDDYLMADQRLPAPVLRNVAEHPMLNFVPLARAWREVTDRDLQPRSVGQALQRHLPEAIA